MHFGSVWIPLAIGGALGAISRYAVAHAIQSAFTGETTATAFPWGTLCVNVIGSFVFGVAFVLVTEVRLFGEGELQTAARFGLLVGFLGAFTTFSTFAFETSQLLVDGRLLAALANAAAQNLASLLAAFLGIALGRAF